MCSLSMFLYSLLFIFHLVHAGGTPKCPCGWRLTTGEQYTHRIYHNFENYSDVTKDILTDPEAKPFTDEFLINGYARPADNPTIRVDMQYSPDNVELKDGNLVLIQRAYSKADAEARKAVGVAGIQSRTLDILHGTFRTTMKIEGASGGSVASFFWYHNDTSEIDIEFVSKGSSIVNNTINYTSHPAVSPDGTSILNATRSVPMPEDDFLATYREHRFDCSPEGVKYFLDGHLEHVDAHSIPQAAGSLQLNLWSDGNRYWSGSASTTDVFMKVKNLLVYFNTTGTNAGTDEKWLETCMSAGQESLCREGDHLDLADLMVQAETPGLKAAPREPNIAFSGRGWSELGCFYACVLMVGITTTFVVFG